MEGYSGSWIKESCRDAVMSPVREAMRKAKKMCEETDEELDQKIIREARGLTIGDFFENGILRHADKARSARSYPDQLKSVMPSSDVSAAD
ncbi:MAG: hypothetical protein MMC33_010167 [Icmadophila ericetorum]|nr:hypothetical protein [Icmadophila ericetorum]